MRKQTLLLLTILFFMMGLITCLNDILTPYMKQVFDLRYGQAALVQFSFFLAYGLTSIPTSNLIGRIGHQKVMVLGFAMAAFGCFLFYPAVSFNIYGIFLAALFILAAGIVMLQLTANLFVSTTGPQSTASSRLAMMQAFNSLGTFIAPFFGSYFILSELVHPPNGTGALQFPYLLIGLALVVIALLLMRLRSPLAAGGGNTEVEATQSSWKEVLAAPGVLLGIVGIFTYVGAEVSIGSFLVNYIMERSQMQETEAANLVAFYWGGAMAGRFLGIFTLREFNVRRVLIFHALMAIALIFISINSYGQRAIYSMILVGICNSIMFPTIFALTINRVERRLAPKTSGLLGAAILGGAILPVLTGHVADELGLRMAYILPALCYGCVAFIGSRMTQQE